MQGAAINPAKIQSVLRQATDQQLVMMLKRPDKIPSMFIQQEISRRQAMRQAAQAEQAKFQQTAPQQQRMPSMDMQKDMDMSRQPIGLKHGGMHFSGVDIDPETGFPRAGALRRDMLRFPNPKSSYQPYAGGPFATTKFGQAYRPSQIGRPNTGVDIPQGFGVPYRSSQPFISEDMKKTMESGIATKDLIEEDISGIDTADAFLGASPTDPNVEKVKYDSPSGIKGFYEGPIKKGENPFKTTEEKEAENKEPFDMKSYLDSIVGGDKTTVTAPDYKGVSSTLDNLEKAFIENNKEAKKSLSDSETGLRTLQSNVNKMFDTQLSNIDSIQKRKIKLLLNTEDLDALKKQSEENYESAIKYLETDTKIADAQKKLLDAMKPQATPAQRFFGYLAQIGADIAASDRETFLEAGGEALSKAMQDYKFDNEKERERFVNNAKLMLEFETLNQQNKMRIFDLKGNLYNMKANNVKDIYERDMEVLKTEEAYNTEKFGLTKDKMVAFENFNQALDQKTLDRLNLNNAHIKDMFSIVEGKSAIEQQQFSNALSLANNELDRIQVMAQFLTPQAKNFNLLQSLPEDQRPDFLQLFAKNTKDGISPDVTARTLATDLVSKIDKLMEESTDTSFTRQDAMKQVMGDDLYGAVVANDGSLDYLKLYQYMFGGVYNIQAGGGIGNIGGGQQPMSFQQYKQGQK